MAHAAMSELQSLDQDLHRILGEQQSNPPDAVEYESAGVGCHSDVGSVGQLVIQGHRHPHLHLFLLFFGFEYSGMLS